MRRAVGLLVIALSLVAAPAGAVEPGVALLEALARPGHDSRPGLAGELRGLSSRGGGAAGCRTALVVLRVADASRRRGPIARPVDGRELAFGAPPSDGIVLLGDFDPTAIGRAFTARGYTGTDVVERALWCPAAGCESGLTIDLHARNTDIPFGGELGRNEPMAVSATDLLGSADIAAIRGMLDAATHEASSLADQPAYRAAVEAVDPDVRLIQATLVPASLMAADVAAILVGSGSAVAARALLAELAATFEPIPTYELVAIVDGATETEQVVSIGLVYDRADDAAVAADVIPRRLETMESLTLRQPFTEVLAGRGVSSVTGRVVTSGAGDKATALIVMRAPLASDQPDPGSGRLTASSLVYRMVLDMAYRRDTLWLAPVLPVFE